jgi:hypothetical protein
MQLRILWIAALTAIATSALCAQDISGNWQGTLKTGIDLRLIVEIAKADGGGWKGTMYSIDQTTNALPVNSVTLDGSNLKFTVDMVRGTFEGKVSADGDSIVGTWSQGQPLPLELRRATKETAALAAFEASDEASTGGQATAFEKGVPTARVVRSARANHYVFLSNEADVLREMNAFMAALP